MDVSLVVTEGNALLNQDVLSQNLEVQISWLEQVGVHLKTWDHIREMTTMKEAEILYSVNSVWPQETNDDLALKSEAVERWGGDFFLWARAFTRRSSKEPSDVTVKNKVTVYRDWVAKSVIDYPEFVRVPKRDELGEILDLTGEDEDAWEEIEFNPLRVDYGKLLVSRGAAKKGEMSDEAWTALADSYATVQELKKAIKLKSKTESKADDSFRIWFDAGTFYATENGATSAFAGLLLDNLDNKLSQRGAEQMLATWGLEMPDDVRWVDIELDMPMVQMQGDTLVLNVEGHKFLEIGNIKDLLLIQDVVIDLLEKRGVTDV